MANRAESGGARYVELRSRTDTPVQEPSLPAAMEKLVTASQGVITKRIDLVMLEVHELVGKLVIRTGLVVFGVIVALAAWFGAIAALVLWLTPTAGPAVHWGIFAGVNAAVGAAVVAFAVREQLPKLGGESEAERDERKADA